MIAAVASCSASVRTSAACRALGVARATVYRARKPAELRPRPSPVRTLSNDERAEVLQVLNSGRFADMAPAAAHATLLDEGRWLCSVRTMYRILAGARQVRERRNQLRHPRYAAPQLLATRPNEVWSWDITKLLGPQKWSYFYLYVMMDIFSRYVVGWMLADRENNQLARELVTEACAKHCVSPGQLTIHADRGAPMTAKPMAHLMADMGITKSHSRPHVSNDNPFSESQFKTMKYRPGYPERFGSIQDARVFARQFFTWYNTEHRHSGIAHLTPQDVHFGRSAQACAQRQQVLDAAYARHPERFVVNPPKAAPLPAAVWINPPSPASMMPQPTRPGPAEYLEAGTLN